MFTLVKNEFIKLFKRPKTRALLVLFFIAAAGCVFLAQRDSVRWEKYDSVEYQIENEESNIKYTKESIEELKKELKTSTDKEEIKSYEENLRYYNEDLENSYKRLEELKKEKLNPIPWQTKLKKEIKESNERIEGIKKEIEVFENSKGMKEADKEREIGRLEREIKSIKDRNVRAEYALSIDVKPLNGGEFVAGNLIMTFSMILSLAIPLFIAIFGSDIVSDEATNETFKFLLIQPVKRSKVLWSKFITLVITTLGLIMGTQIVIFLVVGFTKGFDHLKLLYKVGTKFEYDPIQLKEGFEEVVEIINTGHHITLGEYVGQVFLFQTLFIIAGCALVFMISTVCKSNMISMAASTVVLVGGSILPMFITQLGKYAHLTFLGYNNPTAVIGGEIAYMYYNVSYSSQLGLILMVVSTIVLLAIAQFNFKKKDILV
ncbi:MAG: ABC transporter permease subunit [Clostridium sp.]|uniref:ABC transporter permease subunit n=1 Tax=Clostridium sp. TaxID=1506 RepID=UPI003F408F26